MEPDLHTDEYTISIGREITVCRKMISRAEKNLARFEQKYGLPTEELVRHDRWGEVAEQEARRRWQDEYEGLRAWRQRLEEYESAYLQMR
jgi:hypothetical protein